MNFSDAYDKYRNDIKIISGSQRVPGLDQDDIAQEMLSCLWTACQHYRPERGGFGSFWWSLWLNRRSDLTEQFYATKRVTHLYTDEVPEEGFVVEGVPNPPRGSGPEESLVWRLIAMGESGLSVMETASISKRRYYNIIRRWRTDEVREELTG